MAPVVLYRPMSLKLEKNGVRNANKSNVSVAISQIDLCASLAIQRSSLFWVVLVNVFVNMDMVQHILL